ncbi:hypothetical protein [Zhongshania sp.]|uniref:hypothetical protein n=1 Tax=Zhongshania sp. TaxID=1971902 RepID=UPI0035613337
MYLFSINATAKITHGEFTEGEQAPFIVYIDFKDMFGAENLAKLFVMAEGFTKVEIEKRKLIDNAHIPDNPTLAKDPQILEALVKGYCVQAFNAH